MGNGLISRVVAFAQQPLNASGDAVNWALFFIFAVTVAVAWYHVLGHITQSIAEEL